MADRPSSLERRRPAPPTPPHARAFKLTLEYDGTAYAGWQRQPHAPTVQQVLEEALERVLRHAVRCSAAGRTDAGVHALGQVARVVTTLRTISPEGIRRGGNTHLPPDVRIVAVEPCDISFDPRRDARLRWYRYSILARPSAAALDRSKLWHVPQPLDWAAVEAGLALLRGRHDFRAFRSAACRASRTVLNLIKAEHVAPTQERPAPQGPEPMAPVRGQSVPGRSALAAPARDLPPAGGLPVHHLDFECRSFLHNMVRMMVGLLVEIGLGKHSPKAIEQMLEAGARNRAPSVQFRVAPPHGLALMRVDYAERAASR